MFENVQFSAKSEQHWLIGPYASLFRWTRRTVHELIAYDPNVASRMFNKNTIYDILRVTLDKRMLRARFVPHKLTYEQKMAYGNIQKTKKKRIRFDCDRRWVSVFEIATQNQSATW